MATENSKQPSTPRKKPAAAPKSASAKKPANSSTRAAAKKSSTAQRQEEPTPAAPSIDEVKSAAQLLLHNKKTAVQALLQLSAREVEQFRSLLTRQEISPLRDIEEAWQVTSSQLAAVFGVSRQAYAKWKTSGVPASRLREVAHLAESTEMLKTCLPQRTTLAAAARQLHEELGDRSLLDLLHRRDLGALRRAVHEIFTSTPGE